MAKRRYESAPSPRATTKDDPITPLRSAAVPLGDRSRLWLVVASMAFALLALALLKPADAPAQAGTPDGY